MASGDEIKGVIIAAIVTPILVVLIAVFVIAWLWKVHKRKVNLMRQEKEFSIAYAIANRKYSNVAFSKNWLFFSCVI